MISSASSLYLWGFGALVVRLVAIRRTPLFDKAIGSTVFRPQYLHSSPGIFRYIDQKDTTSPIYLRPTSVSPSCSSLFHPSSPQNHASSCRRLLLQ
ncbi:hypothetical protein F4678DRAFT_434366 [Xylaria arbuscula]|nr:hypothetical protein F4678DRAFT_434366 [Xylaria arbuscula]